MVRVVGLAVVLAAAGSIVFSCAAAAAQPAPSISFSATGTLRVNIGESESVRVFNDTKRTVRVDAGLDLDSPGHPGATVANGGQHDLAAYGSATVRLDVTGEASGWLWVRDLTNGSVIRRALTTGAFVNAAASLKSWTPTISMSPFADTANLGSLPLDSPATCANSTSATSTTLSHAGDVATLTARCRTVDEHAVLDLTVSDLDLWTIGGYEGTLPVGDDEVAIDFTRRAGIGWLLACLLIGVAAAMLVHGFVARRPIGAAKQDVGKLTAPSGPEQWQPTVEKALADTKAELSEVLSTASLWGSRRHFSWLLAPSASATAAVEAAVADLRTANDALQQWKDSAATEFDELKVNVADLPDKLSDRATAITKAGTSAMTEPAEPGEPTAARPGIAGLTAVLAEARALNAVATTYRRLHTMLSAVRDASPPERDGLPLRGLWRRTQAEAHLAINGLLAEVRRGVNAVRLLDDGLVERARVAALLVDRLGRRAVRTLTSNDTQSESDSAADATAWWQIWPVVEHAAARFGRAVVARSRLLGDLLVFGINLVVVLVVGVTTLYIGASWGTPFDMIGALVGALGGSLVITPLIAALDRLGGAEPEGDGA